MSDKQQLSILGIIGMLLSTVIGSGIWKDPLKWANLSGIYGLVAIILVWALFMCMGLAYSESLSMFPKGGGPYSYVGGAFGQRWGTYVGLLYFVSYLFISALLCFLTANFLLSAFNISTTLEELAIITIITVIILGFIASTSSPDMLGKISLAWVGIKIFLILLVALLALLNWQNTNLMAVPTLDNFQKSVNQVLWSLLGFEIVLIFSDETKESAKIIPKGIIIGLFIILGLYLTVFIATVGIMQIGELPANVDVLSILAFKANINVSILNFFAAFSAAGTAYVTLATVIHQLRVMARDAAIPAVFNHKFKHIYLLNFILVSIFTATIAFFMTTQLANWSLSVDNVACIGIGLVLISSALPAGFIAFYMRLKLPALARPFKAPFHFVVFPLALILSVYLIFVNYYDIQSFLPAIISSLVILIVIALITFLGKLSAPSQSKTDW